MTVAVSGQRRSEIKLSQPTQSNHQVDQGLNENSVAAGRRLFEQETFGGNGRTCLT
jgi:hypothetical protein